MKLEKGLQLIKIGLVVGKENDRKMYWQQEKDNQDRLVLDFITSSEQPCDVRGVLESGINLNQLYFSLKRLRRQGLIDSVSSSDSLPLYFVKQPLERFELS